VSGVQRDSGELRTEGAVTELSPGMKGRWIVQTQGTLHLFDLDKWEYSRRQHDGLNPMRQDHEVVALPEDSIILWPQVGSLFRIVVSVDSYSGYMGSVRTSSLIRSITPAGEDE